MFHLDLVFAPQKTQNNNTLQHLSMNMQNPLLILFLLFSIYTHKKAGFFKTILFTDVSQAPKRYHLMNSH